MKPDIQLKRLNALALFLQRWELIQQMYHKPNTYECHDDFCGIKHFHWIFRQFPKVFPGQWHLNDVNMPYHNTYPTLNPLESARRFLQLSPDEHFALFVPGYAYEPFQMLPLKEDARPGTLAHRIYHFMIKKQNQREMNLKMTPQKNENGNNTHTKT